ncbi:methyltransferase-like protein 27 [Oratosquilla oratoria]|uniref:methyltransferase-like protein 27 n=1 Tax=Oratosquilla oratoria TaxID=337810 RepID=UPI003F763E63
MSSSQNLIETNGKCFLPGLTTQEIKNRYSAWALRYHEDMSSKNYRGPEFAANAIASLYKEKERPQIKILDVAAGTGRVGISLQELGFTSIDALDPCEDMLKVLKESGAYKNIYMEYVDEKQSSIPSGMYESHSQVPEKVTASAAARHPLEYAAHHYHHFLEYRDGRVWQRRQVFYAVMSGYHISYQMFMFGVEFVMMPGV